MNPIQSDLSEGQLAELRDSALFNHDLAPVSSANRKWAVGSFAALWISMSACIPTYMLASSLIGGGMNWWQAVLTIFLGNLIVLVPMVLNAHAGTKYGIPFPVYCRASFGTLGANVPAILRALVACGWFGIQAWIGGDAIYKICITILNLHPAPADNWFGINGGQFAGFLFFWAINMWVIYRGIETIRKFCAQGLHPAVNAQKVRLGPGKNYDLTHRRASLRRSRTSLHGAAGSTPLRHALTRASSNRSSASSSGVSGCRGSTSSNNSSASCRFCGAVRI